MGAIADKHFEEIRRLHAEGKTDVEIEIETGLSHRMVGKYRRRMGLPSNGHLAQKKKKKAKK